MNAGQIFAMTGGTRRHNRLGEGPCAAYTAAVNVRFQINADELPLTPVCRTRVSRHLVRRSEEIRRHRTPGGIECVLSSGVSANVQHRWIGVAPDVPCMG